MNKVGLFKMEQTTIYVDCYTNHNNICKKIKTNSTLAEYSFLTLQQQQLELLSDQYLTFRIN